MYLLFPLFGVASYLLFERSETIVNFRYFIVKFSFYVLIVFDLVNDPIGKTVYFFRGSVFVIGASLGARVVGARLSG